MLPWPGAGLLGRGGWSWAGPGQWTHWDSAQCCSTRQDTNTARVITGANHSAK